MFASFHKESLPIEYSTIKCQPFYLTRNFSHFLTFTLVQKNAAVKDLHDTISKCENYDPNTLSIAAGDINQANIESIMPEYKQYATCPSINNRILHHCYCKVK